MVAPKGSIFVCIQKEIVFSLITSWIYYRVSTPRLHLVITTFYSLTNIHMFLRHVHLHTPNCVRFVPSVFCFRVYNSWDVSFFVKMHLCRWIQIWRHPHPGDVSCVHFSHPSNTISPVAFYLSPTNPRPTAPRSLRRALVLSGSQLLLLWAQLVKGNTGAWSSHPPSALAFN